jgi:hypothetical protein
MPARKARALECLHKLYWVGRAVGSGDFREQLKSERTRQVTLEHIQRVFNLNDLEIAEVLHDFENGGDPR